MRNRSEKSNWGCVLGFCFVLFCLSQLNEYQKRKIYEYSSGGINFSILIRHILLSCFPLLYLESHKTFLHYKPIKNTDTSNTSVKEECVFLSAMPTETNAKKLLPQKLVTSLPETVQPFDHEP